MLNKVLLIGYLGNDPDLRSTAGGKAVCNFSMATSEKFKGRDGALQEKTEWHKIVVWDKQAENVHKYCKKGSLVYVEGRIETEKWTDKQGTDRYTTKIQAGLVRFLPNGKGGGQGQSAGGGGGQQESRQQNLPAGDSPGSDGGSGGEFDPDSEIPF